MAYDQNLKEARKTSIPTSRHYCSHHLTQVFSFAFVYAHRECPIHPIVRTLLVLVSVAQSWW